MSVKIKLKLKKQPIDEFLPISEVIKHSESIDESKRKIGRPLDPNSYFYIKCKESRDRAKQLKHVKMIDKLLVKLIKMKESKYNLKIYNLMSKLLESNDLDEYDDF